jgi:UDP-2,3-diacylglucosamine hydrolase
MDTSMPVAIVVADAHLDGWNDELDVFLAFLSSISAYPLRYLYLLGDLFQLWFGAPQFQFPYQQAVVKALQHVQQQGTTVIYVEGNRDYFLTPTFTPQPFAEIATEFTTLELGVKRIYFAHGDLINVKDTQYRRWRQFSRNRWVYGGFRSLPKFLALPLAHYLERVLRGTNQQHKRAFPEDLCMTFARTISERGFDLVVLGHFHEQRQYNWAMQARALTLYALPAWKDTHTYLTLDPEGSGEIHTFTDH